VSSRKNFNINTIPWDYQLIYTMRMYSEFEKEFKHQYSFACKLLETRSTSTLLITHMYSYCGATVVFNNADKIITCSCIKFKSIHTCTCLKQNFPLYIYMTIHLHICMYILQAYHGKCSSQDMERREC
jgi:hypothetical protein